MFLLQLSDYPQEETKMLAVIPAHPRWIAVGQVSDLPYVDPRSAQSLVSGAVREKVRNTMSEPVVFLRASFSKRFPNPSILWPTEQTEYTEEACPPLSAPKATRDWVSVYSVCSVGNDPSVTTVAAAPRWVIRGQPELQFEVFREFDFLEIMPTAEIVNTRASR
ncbi:MAG: hypothetical protein HY736_04290 [Verrucomicrobia bacterium]|nr:hypothetical protein [Verrucomicrobiota bacterium]